jgi:hypothetical protein
MRTVFWASAFIAATLQSLPAAIEARQAAAVELTFADSSGLNFSLRVVPDQFSAPETSAQEVQVIALTGGDKLVLVDSFASRPGPMSMCQAGVERTLRVVRVHRGIASQVRQLKVASCHTGLELAEPPFKWSAATSTLTIRWLIGPKKQRRPEERRIVVR